MIVTDILKIFSSLLFRFELLSLMKITNFIDYVILTRLLYNYISDQVDQRLHLRNTKLIINYVLNILFAAFILTGIKIFYRSNFLIFKHVTILDYFRYSEDIIMLYYK